VLLVKLGSGDIVNAELTFRHYTLDLIKPNVATRSPPTRIWGRNHSRISQKRSRPGSDRIVLTIKRTVYKNTRSICWFGLFAALDLA